MCMYTSEKAGAEMRRCFLHSSPSVVTIFFSIIMSNLTSECMNTLTLPYLAKPLYNSVGLGKAG